MQRLDSIEIRGGHRRCIELHRGDLTTLSPSEAFDLLVVSAFPGNYSPTPRSLIGALHRKGLDVDALARDKQTDLRASFSCWLSKELTPRDPDLRFRRILCFEPRAPSTAPERVGDIFRALAPILAERSELKSAAMPIVAAGERGYPFADMLSSLLDAALHWLENGLPLDRIIIVAHTDDQAREAARTLGERKAAYFAAAPALAALDTRSVDYDVFISYSKANLKESQMLEQELRELRPGIKIFVDRKEIDVGAAWQLEIFESIDRCRKVVAMLSPDYLGSKVCKEEFSLAWMRGRETDENTIFPVYLYTANLPTYMKSRNYVDCREGDRAKIAEASRQLLAALDEARSSPPT
jgi:hypothetical protein